MLKKIAIYLAVICLLVFLDQFSKYLVVTNIGLHLKIEIIPGLFELTNVRNTGMGFSLLEGALNLFYFITPLAVALLVYLLYKDRHTLWYNQLSFLLMIAGALGNFIDRLRLGYVVDFLSFDIFSYRFPVFNLADTFLTIGVAIFLLCYVFDLRYGRNSISKN